MKTFALLTLVALFGCSQKPADPKPSKTANPVDVQRAKEREAIEHVFLKRTACLNKASRLIGGPKNRRLQVNQKLYYQLCLEISTDDCPKNFKLAWFDYMTAWGKNQQAQRMLFLDGLFAVAATETGLVAIAPGALKSAKNHIDEVQHNDPSIAFRPVERIAIEYDLDLKEMER